MNSPSPIWASTTPPGLAASRHLGTDEIFFPAVPADSPLADQFQDTTLSVEGRVYSFTIMHPSPKSGLNPFVLAYVDLSGPVRLFGRLNGSSGRPFIGEKCRVIADETFGYVFESLEVRP